MSRSISPAAGGAFAHGRRGGLTIEEVREIEAHRNRERPTPWAALARRYGRCEADLRAVFNPATANACTPMERIVLPQAKSDSHRRDSFWSDERVKRMTSLYIEGGKTASETGAALGCSKSAVIGKARTMGYFRNAGRKRVTLAAAGFIASGDALANALRDLALSASPANADALQALADEVQAA